MWQGEIDRDTKEVRLWVLTGHALIRYAADMLKRTTCQLDPDTLAGLQGQYPNLTQSEIIRLCMSFTLHNKPTLIVGETKLSLYSNGSNWEPEAEIRKGE